MEENKQIRIPLREDYRNGDLLRGRDVNKITHRVNELTGDIDKIDIDLSGKLDTSAYTEDKAAIESRIDGLAGELSTKEDISAHTADMEAIRASLDKKVEVSAYTENNTRLYGRINSVVNQCTRLDISKQDKLSAGTNITIENDVISAQQPDLSPYALSADVTTELSKKVDTTAYTQDKAAIEASISANTTAITQLETSKQNNLSAGTGIQIQNDVISLTGAGGAQIDDNVTGSTTCWSSQKTVNEMGIGLIDLTNSGNAIRF